MRIQDNEQKQFVNYLLQIGEGKELVYPEIGEDIIKLQDDITLNNENVDSLITEIFGNINDNYKDTTNYIDYIKDQAILSTKNDDINDINKHKLSTYFLEMHKNLYLHIQ